MIMTYEEFEDKMAKQFPRYFGEDKCYGGFAIGEGWYFVVESLVSQIDHYTKWRRNMRAHDLRKQRAKDKGLGALIQFMAGKKRTPTDWDIERAEQAMENDISITPKIHWIRVEQIKEKFGGLRFYYQGGDEHIDGMVAMAEVWAGHTCETCGNKGDRRNGGWVRTLCDVHEAEYQEKMSKYRSEDE
jgi:hypothetical protein